MPPDREVSLHELLREVCKRLFRVMIPIIAYAIIVVATLLLMIDGGEVVLVTRPKIADDQNILLNYIAWFSIFYTLTLSSIVGQGWRKFLRVNSEIDREADALVLLLRTSEMCSKRHLKIKDKLTRTVILYVEKVKLWRREDRRVESPSAEFMKKIHVCIKEFVKKKDISDAIKSELLHHYCDAYDARGDRFDLIAQKLPKGVWFILIIISFTWLWGFVWLKVWSPLLKVYMSVGVMGMVSFLYFIAKDLDNLTTGYFKMDFAPFEHKEFQYNAQKWRDDHDDRQRNARGRIDETTSGGVPNPPGKTRGGNSAKSQSR